MKLCLEPRLTVVQSAYILLHYYNLGWTGLGCTRARRSFFLINSIIPLCSEGQPVLLEPRKGKGRRHEGAYALQKTTRSFHFIGPHPDSGGSGRSKHWSGLSCAIWLSREWGWRSGWAATPPYPGRALKTRPTLAKTGNRHSLLHSLK